MYSFYLNECIIGTYCKAVLSQAMQELVITFKQLVEETDEQVSKAWLGYTSPDKMKFCNVPLKEIIEGMPNREVRKIYYSFQINHPVDNYVLGYDGLDLLEKEYTFLGKEAINLAIISKGDEYVMSLSLCDKLRCNRLELIPNHKNYPILYADNFWGGEANKKYIISSMLEKNYKRSSGLDRIKFLTDNVEWSQDFEDVFGEYSKTEQDYVLDRFNEARKNSILSPIQPEGNIIKKIREYVFELRVVNPIDIRVYFYEKERNMYIDRIKKKSEYSTKVEQTKDIDAAEKRIKEYLQI